MARINYVYMEGKEGTIITEEQLISSILAGNQAGFTRLVQTYTPYLLAVILPIVRDRNDAEDVAQETWLQIYRSLPQYRQAGFKTWMAKIAAHKAIDWKRKKERRRVEELVDFVEEFPQTMANQHGSPEESLLRKEKELLVRKKCSGLPRIYRDAIESYYFYYQSYSDIAQAQGITVKTVESRLYRAKQMLKEQWREGEL